MNPLEKWYALRTKLRMEKSTGEILRGKGYETYVPVYISRRQWADRIKNLELPLFAGYIFCRFDPSNRLPILTTPGVIAVVGTRSEPVPVPTEELTAVQTLVAFSQAEVKPFPYILEGDPVCIRSGPFTGLVGVLLSIKNSYRLVVSIPLIQRAVAVEIDSYHVVKLSVGPGSRRLP